MEASTIVTVLIGLACLFLLLWIANQAITWCRRLGSGARAYQSWRNRRLAEGKRSLCLWQALIAGLLCGLAFLLVALPLLLSLGLKGLATCIALPLLIFLALKLTAQPGQPLRQHRAVRKGEGLFNSRVRPLVARMSRKHWAAVTAVAVAASVAVFLVLWDNPEEVAEKQAVDVASLLNGDYAGFVGRARGFQLVGAPLVDERGVELYLSGVVGEVISQPVPTEAPPAAQKSYNRDIYSGAAWSVVTVRWRGQAEVAIEESVSRGTLVADQPPFLVEGTYHAYYAENDGGRFLEFVSFDQGAPLVFPDVGQAAGEPQAVAERTLLTFFNFEQNDAVSYDTANAELHLENPPVLTPEVSDYEEFPNDAAPQVLETEACGYYSGIMPQSATLASDDDQLTLTKKPDDAEGVIAQAEFVGIAKPSASYDCDGQEEQIESRVAYWMVLLRSRQDKAGQWHVARLIVSNLDSNADPGGDKYLTVVASDAEIMEPPGTPAIDDEDGYIEEVLAEALAAPALGPMTTDESTTPNLPSAETEEPESAGEPLEEQLPTSEPEVQSEESTEPSGYTPGLEPEVGDE